MRDRTSVDRPSIMRRFMSNPSRRCWLADRSGAQHLPRKWVGALSETEKRSLQEASRLRAARFLRRSGIRTPPKLTGSADLQNQQKRQDRQPQRDKKPEPTPPPV